MWWMPTFLQRSHHMTVAQAGELLGTMHLDCRSRGHLVSRLSNGAPCSKRSATCGAIPWMGDCADNSAIYCSVLRVIRAGGDCSVVDFRACGVVLHWPDTWASTKSLALRTCVLQHVPFCCLSPMSRIVVAPQAIGWLSDWFRASYSAGEESLRWALLLLVPTGFSAAWHFWASRATIREDCARAS
jgi:hypothetical protein